jgi:plasmid stabilization system protein ParE
VSLPVFWTQTAGNQLQGIYQYIAQNSERYAIRTVERIIDRSEQIGSLPLSGRRVPEYELDQLREVIESPYRIMYHIRSDRVDIVAVIHGARDDLT